MGKTTSMPLLLARTALGDVRGVAHYGLAQFRGVPYAVPPLGEQRFRPPQPAGASEDCLTLTITTTTKGSSRKKIPRRLDPARPHEQESRRDATATGQAPQGPGLVSKDPGGESP
jgi:hypothetical protein